MSPILDLRAGVRATLAADAALAALLGGPRVYDRAPPGALPPYVAFGDALARDWSTGTDRGFEALFSIDAWSSQPGEGEALAIADRCWTLLEDSAPTLSTWRAVNLRALAVETKRERAGRYLRATLRMRCVLEPL
ncbi:MAG: DUF3168 domain-containing protein [Hyphomicrobiales bacterium]|nr:DUF3168 domain-containing protein [Hyphomicrobiales bacterium]